MSDKNHDFGSLVCIYAQLLPRIRKAAKRLGYAIAIHGTIRDRRCRETRQGSRGTNATAARPAFVEHHLGRHAVYRSERDAAKTVRAFMLAIALLIPAPIGSPTASFDAARAAIACNAMIAGPRLSDVANWQRIYTREFLHEQMRFNRACRANFETWLATDLDGSTAELLVDLDRLNKVYDLLGDAISDEPPAWRLQQLVELHWMIGPAAYDSLLLPPVVPLLAFREIR